jgi:L-ascorbate metabolism protein UlaG (beta-lactamase superfamily)
MAQTRFFLGAVFLMFAAVSFHTSVPVAGAETPIPAIRIDDQVILPSESFDPVVLAGAIQDESYPADQLTWTITGSTALVVENAEGVVSVTPPDVSWRGSETLHFEACDSAGVCSSDDAIFWVMEDANVPVTVTYVGNSGFMITAGDKKILIDGLWSTDAESDPQPADVSDAQPPFDGIDLILVTHDHGDHFSADMVCQYLQNNPDTVFASTEAAANAVIALGCPAISIDLQEGQSMEMIINDIGLEAMFLSHGIPDYENLGYVVTTGGRRFFHTGDIEFNNAVRSDLNAFGIRDKQVDAAFIQHFYLRSSYSAILTTVQPTYIIPIHYFFTEPPLDRDLVLRSYPDAIFFDQELETWSMPEN